MPETKYQARYRKQKERGERRVLITFSEEELEALSILYPDHDRSYIVRTIVQKHLKGKV